MKTTLEFFESILKVVHPWMPFISEELWHQIARRSNKECLIVAEWPKVSKPDENILTGFQIASEIIQQVRNIRSQRGLSPKEPLSLFIKKDPQFDQQFNAIINKLGNVDKIEFAEQKPANAISFLIKQFEFYVPMPSGIDSAAEKERLLKELEYNKGFLKSVQSKLANERFVSNAKPEIVENERKKQADAEAKIRELITALGRG